MASEVFYFFQQKSVIMQLSNCSHFMEFFLDIYAVPCGYNLEVIRYNSHL